MHFDQHLKGWCYLSQETVNRVREAESNALAMIEQARKEKDSRIAEAKAASDEKIKGAHALCGDIAKKARDEIAAQRQTIIEEKTIKAKENANIIAASTEEKMDGAIGIIITEIFNKWQ